MSKPLLSVIIPVYNTQDFLEECLETTIVNDERVQYIIVNDGSIDNSSKIINRIAIGFSNVILVNQRNKGLSEARNAGLRLVNSKWVTFVDSDDFMDKFRIQRIVDYLEKSDNCDLYSLPVMSYENGKRKVAQDCNDNHTINEYIYRVMKGNFQIGVWSYVFRTEIIRNNHIFFDKGRLFEDKFFLPKYLKNISNVQSLPSNKVGYYYYRMRSNSITHKKMSLKKLTDWHDSGVYITDFFLKFKKLDSKTVFAINEPEMSI